MGVSPLLRLTWPACALLLAGCQSYRAEPFDAETFGRAWRARSEGIATARPLPPAAANDLTNGLTLPEAEAVALLYNPALRVARLTSGVAQARAAHAGRWADPVLAVDAERIVSGAADPWVVGGVVNLTLPLTGRLEAEKRRAAAEHTAELVRVAGQEWATRQRLKMTWAEWSTQAQRLALLDALIGRLDSLNRVVERLATAGALTRIEARLFRIERATRQAERIASAARLTELRLDLLATLGLMPDAPVTFVPAMPIEPVPVEAAALVARNFDIRTAAAEYETAERALQREVRAQYPDLVLGPGFGTDEGDERVLLGLSLPLPLWNRNQAAIAEASANRRLARTKLEMVIETQTGALAAARLRFDTAVRQRQLYESTIVPAADEQAGDADRLAGMGEVNAVLLLDAFVRQHGARLALLDARLAEAKAAAQLAELAGDAPVNGEAKEGVR